MLRDRIAWLLFSGLCCLFVILLIIPLLQVISGGFWVNGRLTGHYLWGVFRNPIYAEGMLNSFKIACGTTFLASCLALPLAWIAHNYSFRGKTIFNALLLVPLVLPPFVGAIGILQILGPYGALNALLQCGPIDWLGARLGSVIILQALTFYPIIYLNVSAALANIDPALQEAAQNMGATLGQRLRRIILPLIMPGLFAGCSLVFITAFTELGTPMILNVSRCAAVQVYDELNEISASPFPYALVSVVLCVSLVLYGITKLLLGRNAYAMYAKSTTAHQAQPLSGYRALLALLPFLLVTGLALTPHLGVFLTSFSVPGAWYQSLVPSAWTTANYTQALGNGMTLDAIRNSLWFSFLAVLLNLTLGITTAWVLTRSTLRYRALLDGLAMLPLAVPGLIMAFGFLSLSTQLANSPLLQTWPALVRLVDVRANPTLFLIIAYAVRRLPFMVRAAVAGLQQTSVTLEEAAANLGAKPLTSLRRITLPLISANLIAGALLAFAFSMLEVSDSLILAQQRAFYPITKTIFELFQLIGVGHYLATALGVWVMLFLALTLASASLLLGKKLGALFRM